jgi:hypothetical protein
LNVAGFSAILASVLGLRCRAAAGGHRIVDGTTTP